MNSSFKSEAGTGEGYGKCAAVIRRAGDRDIAAMGPGNGSGKAQTETDADL